MFIYNIGLVVLNLCTFQSCTAREGGGLFVYEHGTIVHMHATYFTGNSATSLVGRDIYR